MNRIKQLIKGKSVAIVGNAESILYYPYGNDIDSKDVVIRINNGYPRRNTFKSTGRRTDILMLCGDFRNRNDISVCKRFKYKYIVSIDRNQLNEAMRNYVRYPQEYVNDIGLKVYNTSKSHPHASTGLNALDMCMRLGAKTIHLYGFDFFKTIDWSAYTEPGRINPAHNFFIEEKYIKQLVRDNENIIMEGKDMARPKKFKDIIVKKPVLEKKVVTKVEKVAQVGFAYCSKCGRKNNIKNIKCNLCSTPL